MVTDFFPSFIEMPSLINGSLVAFALCSALRISKPNPSFAIFKTLRLALPGEGSK